MNPEGGVAAPFNISIGTPRISAQAATPGGPHAASIKKMELIAKFGLNLASTPEPEQSNNRGGPFQQTPRRQGSTSSIQQIEDMNHILIDE